MNTPWPQSYYDLVDEAVPFFQEHGTVDLVHLAKAAEMGVQHWTFSRDVGRAADELERQ